ncbi:hypothetical protein F0562_005710 [Nyssa sinensis]|uniref:EamA domain-containing protein n=1 Tax=Nyssa sinensis TaxID=561372 RepID=A0A5J5AK30_9ASTE|nr:hypothetical protein F0562_005710 [Nyssa sinensis]
MIVYGPKLDDRPIELEIWPTDPNEVQLVINSYKKQSTDDRKKRTVDLSNFFEDRRRKLEDSIVKLRKKNDEAKFPTWEDRYNNLSEEQLRELGGMLEIKHEAVKLKIEFIKGNQRLTALGMMDGSHMQSTQNHSNYFMQAGLVRRRSMQLEVLQEQPFTSLTPLNADVPVHYPLDQGLPFDQANSMANPMMMMLMNDHNCSQQGRASSSKAQYAAALNGPVYYDPMRYYDPMQPMASYMQYPMVPNAASLLHASQTDGSVFIVATENRSFETVAAHGILKMLSKAAFDVGMNTFVFVFYRQAAATVFLAPLAMFFEWKNAPPLSFVTFCKIFMLSLCGITLSLNFYGVGLIYTSASLAAASTNSLPVITFFFSVLFRMEMLRLRTIPGITKVAGIAICMAGAATIALYRGPYMKLLPHHHLLGHHNSQEHQGHVSHGTTWIKGCLLMLTSNIFWGLWLVLQGIVVTGVTYYLQAWVIEKKGPVFLAMSTPLALVFTIFSSAFLLGETISLGSVLGGILLVGGLYSVLWGKNKEQKMDDGICLTADQKESSESKEAIATKIPPPLPV